MQPEAPLPVAGTLAGQEIGIINEALADFPFAECVEQRALTDPRRVGLVVVGRYLDRVGLRPGVKRKDDSDCRG